MRRARVGCYASPVGPLTVFEGPSGVFRVSFRRVSESEIESTLGAMKLDRQESEPKLFAELDRYFSGKLERFRTRADLTLAGPPSCFRRRALETLARVPYGTVLSYGDLARRMGQPGAARAVGGAMRENPVPILIPCHRVLAHDGSLGGFSAGLGKKRALHRLEGIELS